MVIDLRFCDRTVRARFLKPSTSSCSTTLFSRILALWEFNFLTYARFIHYFSVSDLRCSSSRFFLRSFNLSFGCFYNFLSSNLFSRSCAFNFLFYFLFYNLPSFFFARNYPLKFFIFNLTFTLLFNLFLRKYAFANFYNFRWIKK